MSLKMKGGNILLGVTGSIAVYKVADLVRILKKKKFNVRVILTPFAERFVGRLTWDTLTGFRSMVDWSEDPLAHINLARWANVFIIAPCSLNTISKIALGIADNLLTSTFLAYDKPVLISPVANPVMYSKSVIREHIKRLKESGHLIIEPDYGIMACEEEGMGKLPEVERLEDWIYYMLYPKKLEGKKVLITCGATREYMDKVRFISNDSSGETGFSLARMFRWYGADVRVIAGFTTAKEPYEVYIERVISSKDMFEAVKRHVEWADIIVMNAAVSDFRPIHKSEGKVKKEEIGDCIKVELTEDILEYLGRVKGDKLLIGFALESENLISKAKEKLKVKGADFIIVNPSEVMGSDAYEGYIVDGKGIVLEIKEDNKLSSAEKIVEFIANRMGE